MIKHSRRVSIAAVILLSGMLFSETCGAADSKAWASMRESGRHAFEKKDYRSAKDFFTSALSEARGFDAQDTRLAESLADLAETDYVLGDFSAAEPLFRQAAEIRRNDPNQTLEATVLYDLGLTSERLRHFDDAAAAFQQAEDILSRKSGANSTEAVTMVFHRGMVYYEQHEDAKAEPLLKRAYTLFRIPAAKIVFRKGDAAAGGMDVYRLSYRPSHVYALQAIAMLSQIYIRQHEMPKAEESFKEALDLVDEYAGKNDPEIPLVLRALATFYLGTEKYASAEPVLVRLLKIQEKNPGATDVVTLRTEDELARTYAKEKKNAQAESLYKKIVNQKEGSSGPDDRDTMVAVANLAKFYMDQGNYEKAEPIYRRQMDYVDKYQGYGAAMTPILADQQIIYTKLGKDSELETVLRRKITLFEKMFGSNSPTLVTPLNDCAQMLRKEKRDAEAEPLESRASAIKSAQTK